MSTEIVKVYKQDVPALRFIGKKYGNNDRVNGMFGKHWEDWFQNGWFSIIEKQIDNDLKTIFEDGDAYIGLMRGEDAESFEYWIGIFMPSGTNVPEGYDYHDFPKSTLGVCWLHGKEPEVYKQEEKCLKNY
jgi:predicted transcriptional regulator YdeE